MAEVGNLIDEAQKEYSPQLSWLYWAINKRNKSLLFCFEGSEERGLADLLSRFVSVLKGHKSTSGPSQGCKLGNYFPVLQS